eukprot:1142849-Pelagomonas_calceolata.AAC.2
MNVIALALQIVLSTTCARSTKQGGHTDEKGKYKKRSNVGWLRAKTGQWVMMVGGSKVFRANQHTQQRQAQAHYRASRGGHMMPPRLKEAKFLNICAPKLLQPSPVKQAAACMRWPFATA